MFYNSYLSGSLLISVVCQTFIFCEQNKLFWEQNQTKKLSRWLILILDCKLEFMK